MLQTVPCLYCDLYHCFGTTRGVERTLRRLDLKKKHNIREILHIYPIDIYTITEGDGHFLNLFDKKDVPQGFTNHHVSSLTLALETYEWCVK